MDTTRTLQYIKYTTADFNFIEILISETAHIFSCYPWEISRSEICLKDTGENVVIYELSSDIKISILMDESKSDQIKPF